MSSPQKSSFLSRHWFLIALVTVLPLGVLGADALAPLNYFTSARTLLVCLVMGLMALPIPFELIRLSLARPWPAVLASLINMAVVPLLAGVAALTLSAYLGGGLIVAAAIPCTLASAAVWTRRAGGDDTVAILVTLLTNMSCVVITPVWLVLLLGRNVHLEILPLIQELVLVVLLPIIVAQLLRTRRTVAAWAERRKQTLAVTCQLGILLMVLSGSIQMGQHLQNAPVAPDSQNLAESPAPTATDLEQASPATASPATTSPATQPAVSAIEVVWTVILAATIHLVAMAIGWYLAAATRVARPQQVAVAIAGSQKTLMIGLKMALDCGVSIIPMVAFHVGQLLLDTFIADRMKQLDRE